MFENKQTYLGAPASGPWSDVFFRALGSSEPPEVVIVPVIVFDEVVMMLYGDNDGLPVEVSPTVELLAHQIGMTLERRLLELHIGGA